jgi:DNA/RNA endonuclease YhcR with UshA esterase domain
MMKWLLITVLSCSGVLAQEAPLVLQVEDIEKIRAAEGKLAKVRGVIESTGKSRGSGMNYLNFPGREFSAVVFGRSLKNFPDGEPADTLKGKLVEVSGKITFYKGEPQMIVESPDQISVLDPETKKPEVVEEPVKEEPEPEPVVEEEKPDGPEPEKPDPGKVDPRDYFDDP